ncbi:hypothetical protein F4775DRAFT_555772 [Biscogniauxia sp. FL1348]|nr:hypothetical protein F4775DRAFT_555772 [Biscogniauxia sp. FL1348]
MLFSFLLFLHSTSNTYINQSILISYLDNPTSLQLHTYLPTYNFRIKEKVTYLPTSLYFLISINLGIFCFNCIHVQTHPISCLFHSRLLTQILDFYPPLKKEQVATIDLPTYQRYGK